MTGLNGVKPIVVAVDGSDSASRAVRWAAAEAHLRRRRLRIVHAYDWPPPLYGPVLVDPVTAREAALRAATTVVCHAATVAAEVAPELCPETEALSGPARRVLREVSRQAALLVLGSHGLTGLLAGSVAVALAARGRCPVVVVRGAEPIPGGPVVVGVDGSAASEAAIALAFDEAGMHGADLVAVHAWMPPVTDARELLAERLAGWQEKYPEVAVRRVVRRDLPVRTLLDTARDARLLVVGSRGRGGSAGVLLGSVSQALIHRAPCPVLIARPDAGR